MPVFPIFASFIHFPGFSSQYNCYTIYDSCYTIDCIRFGPLPYPATIDDTAKALAPLRYKRLAIFTHTIKANQSS
nr:MAG TPA: hypothetical protein [Bacteriophage sp.]